MAKRFTDTDKWKREWFSELDLRGKLVWFYILDQCDHRGVWFSNFKLLSLQVGFKVTKEMFELWFGAKVRLFEVDKYFIPSFVEFQYGKLNPGNNAHKSVIELIEKLGPQEPLKSPSGGAQDKDTDKDKDKENVLRGGMGQIFKVTTEMLEQAYDLYPRKEGKAEGFKRLKIELKSESDIEAFVQAIHAYKARLKRDKVDSKFIKMFSSFVTNWRDCLEPNYGQVEEFKGSNSGIEQWKRENGVA